MFIEQKQYEEIIKIFPRACVDILIVDEQERVLLLLRENEPAQGQWWFPGGRIHFGETRLEAARRKLKEECALEVTKLTEVATFDLFFTAAGTTFHDVTILFKMVVSSIAEIQTDNQAKDYGWFTPEEYGAFNLHPYVLENLKNVIKKAECNYFD
jgi:ADP-ribose pyrophosphatase YjhB (NUDIX family)